ncbi:hypothetical protein [Novipirellula caenicola]|uniref:Uncharacterized protein n=1 Tax=Novipirellula caenicola TaxID=1536901 RepID=A0ABP9W0M2_9BACT
MLGYALCSRFATDFSFVVPQYLILVQLITDPSKNRTGAAGSQPTPRTWHHFALFNRDQVRVTSTCPVEIHLIRSEYRSQTLARKSRQSPRMNISPSNGRRDLATTNAVRR